MLLNKSFKKKVVLISGSSKGIGSKITDVFLDQGCTVIGISRKKVVLKKIKIILIIIILHVIYQIIMS